MHFHQDLSWVQAGGVDMVGVEDHVVVEEAGQVLEEVQLPLLWVLYSLSPTQEITGHGLGVLRGLGLARVGVEEEEGGIEAAHRVGHLLEGPLLTAAETPRTRDSTTGRKMVTEEVTAVVVIAVVLGAIGKIPNEALSAVRAHALVGALVKPPSGTATVAITAAVADAQSQVQNQNRQTRALKKTNQALKRTNQALKRTAATRVRVPAHQPAGHDRIRGMVYVVGVRMPMLVPLV